MKLLHRSLPQVNDEISSQIEHSPLNNVLLYVQNVCFEQCETMYVVYDCLARVMYSVQAVHSVSETDRIKKVEFRE